MSTRRPHPSDEELESVEDQRPDAESEAVAQAQAEDEPGAEDSVEALEAADIDAGPEPDVSLESLRARARKLEADEVRRIVESLLFVSDKPLAPEVIEKVTGIAPDVAETALGALRAQYEAVRGGVVLHEVAGGWQLRTAPESAEFVRRMLQIKPQRLTRAALETLAIIAYRQPVTRPEIEDIRAVDSGAILKALLERKLIKILGKKEEPGHPLLYGTTREFLEFFNLKNLASLPTLREFQELSEESREIVEKETGPAPQIQGTVAALADEAFLARQKASIDASEAALADLEAAMDAAEAKTKETEEILNPKPPEPPPAEPGVEPVPGAEAAQAPAGDAPSPSEPVAAEPAPAPEAAAPAHPPRKRKAKEPAAPAPEGEPANPEDRKE